jgi:restriction system protein
MAQFAPDGVPTIDGCRPAVLRVLADGQERQLKDVISEVGDYLKLSEDAVNQRIASGQGRLENRVGWACSALREAGLIDRPKRGWYQITESGHAVDQRNLLTYSEDDMLEWATWREYQAELAERKKRSSAEPNLAETDTTTAPIDGQDSDPLSTVADNVQALNNAVETELRSTLQQSSPAFFERAVLEVLWAMGYGGGHGEKEHLGQSNDGGIDGVIRQDPLGLQNVYVQAKRYADVNTVGSPDINGFYGALARRGADRGVFITTSTFSPAAREAAKQFGGKIVLIDGIRLTSLMLRYGVGVEVSQAFQIFEVNQDFFDN